MFIQLPWRVKTPPSAPPRQDRFAVEHQDADERQHRPQGQEPKPDEQTALPADSHTAPANCATSRPVIGRMISTPNCWAVRASFARDDTSSATCSDASADAGPDQGDEDQRSRIEHGGRHARLGQQGDEAEVRDQPRRRHGERRQQRAEHLGDQQARAS